MTTHYALIVHPNPDRAGQICDLMLGMRDENVEYDLRPTQARDRAGAEAKFKEAGLKTKTFDLVVTALEIAKDDNSAILPGEQRRLGLDLVGSLLNDRPGLRAIVLITGSASSDVISWTQSKGVGLAAEDHQFEQTLKSQLRLLLGTAKPQASPRVNVFITLRLQGCSYRFEVEGSAPEEEKFLEVDPKRLKDFVALFTGMPIDEPKFFGVFLRRLGEDLGSELFEDAYKNRAFKDEFYTYTAKYGDENVRVRFNVDEELYPIVAEALKGRSEDNFWMMKHEISRREMRGVGPPRSGLFQDLPAINFLLIQADVEKGASVDDRDTGLKIPSLAQLNVGAEIAAIESRLTAIKDSGRPIGAIRTIKPSDVPAGGTFSNLVETVLSNDNWHVIHYGGHTHYDADKNIGYLLFPARGETTVKPIKIDVFASWLQRAKARFIYLSSCKSAGHDFIYHLAKEGVPAILGFLWKVEDERAHEFADKFYQFLFDDPLSLEHACFKARTEMHKEREDSSIWASPVLVMQVAV